MDNDKVRLENRLKEAGIQLDAAKFQSDYNMLQKIADALNDKNIAKAKNIFHLHKFSFSVTEEQAKKLWEIGMDQDILPQHKTRLDSESTKKKKKKGKKH
ncbi:hypothetical protein KJB30_04920 [Geobacter chapellei]|uniref:Uncharacterized protein n=1 Tax=Pelotalea chapellei TaxID=44671 RepID=A0ABS5U628_9BACT|nr:hypothetical protein [Pelotalea chapellei]MBT1071112.1 hypothetical protein [Pelotalea chapellei]